MGAVICGHMLTGTPPTSNKKGRVVQRVEEKLY